MWRTPPPGAPSLQKMPPRCKRCGERPLPGAPRDSPGFAPGFKRANNCSNIRKHVNNRVPFRGPRGRKLIHFNK
eukprot:8925481-Lingulodinium_polyedra.AAC.1